MTRAIIGEQNPVFVSIDRMNPPKHYSRKEEQLRGLLILGMKHKAIAIVVVAALSVGSAAAFASQDSVFQGTYSGTSQVVGQEETLTAEATDVIEATQTPESTAVEEATATPTPAEVEEDTRTLTATEVTEATPTPEPTEVTEPTPTPGEGPRDVVGIPDDNPSKQPEDGDGVCEKGETVIKTTPSGKQVNVPCQAVKEHGPKAGHVEDEEEGTE